MNRLDDHTVNNTIHGVGFRLLNASAYDNEEIDAALKLLSTKRNNVGNGVVGIDCRDSLPRLPLDGSNQSKRLHSKNGLD